uniref:uveal autoantigen with coiled-coil domains and ankyrin repeats protein-like isoform X1 n=1 Tax=Styela clava TaxID=7725 RepID=UPI00193A1CFB|nr:uveal autoantigen with coiled-coil domains and ankyrin repeats protein-like isoform X1 [Styela clava]XP_039260678.1 uveal autoantigen with coiled-coil domains and ankyrin repeats protein-like isoform X1 [Styela clava]
MEPVAIARITDEGKFIIDNDKLVEIFGPLKDKDLSIISVAGSYRTGKSFMLNFFIRYLHERGWKYSNWLGSDDKKLQDGFDWKRGSDPHTKGINVWPEVFEVPLENGKKISVMIVDTQGLFDNDNTPDINAKIMSISTLLCSHQILNIQNRLQEIDLEHLQLSVEYACAAVGLQGERDEIDKQRTTFQKFTFLIRDWVNDDEFPYGNGGDKYLNKILKAKSKSKTVNDVKESVHRAFNEVKGFLMPQPGKRVCKGERSTLTNADIKPIFREYTMQLTEAVLHPRNLILKQMFGKPISASALMNLLAAVSNSFTDGKLPEIETMLKNTVRANNDEAVQRAVRRYKEVMTELVHGEIAVTDVLRNFHDNAVVEATKSFKEISTLGEESDRKKARQHAIKECENYYKIVEQENETRKSKVIEEINNLSLAMETQYTQKMRDHDLSTLSKEDLGSINNTLSDLILLKFYKQAKGCQQVMPSEVENKRKTLEQHLSAHYEMFEKERLHEERIKELVQQMDKLGINQKANEVLSKFQKAFSQYEDEYCMDIESLRKTEYKKCLEQFDAEIAKYDDYATVKNTREKLSTNMEQYFTENVKRVNENNKRDLGLKYEQHVENAVNEYDRLMKQITSDGKWEKNIDFIQKHDEYRKKAAEDFNRLIANISPSLPHEDVQEYRQKLDNKMEERFNSIHKQSNDNNIHLQEVKEQMDKLGINQEASKVLTKFQEAFSQYGDEYCMDIESLRKTEYEKCLEEYDTEIAKYDDYATVKNTREKLSTNMEQYFTENVKRVNENNKRDLGLKYEQHVENAVDEYDQMMRQITLDGKWEKNIDFIQKHDGYRKKAAEDFNRLIANISPSLPHEDVQEYRQKLDNKMEERFNSIHKQSNDNNIHLQEVKEQMDKLGINQEASKVLTKFQEAFSQYGDEYCMDIERLRKTEYEKCLEEYDTEIAKYDDYATVKNTREKLSTNMEQYFTENVKRVNENNKRDLGLKYEQHVGNAVDEYDQMMRQITSDGKWEKNIDFIQKHNEYKEKAAEDFNRLIANISPSLPHEDVQEYRQKLDNKMEERFNSIHKQSNDNNIHLQEMKKQMDKLGINQEASQVMTKFQEAFSQYGDEYCMDIESLRKTEYEKCLKEYDTEIAKYDDYATVKNTREKLSTNMEQYFTENVKRVNENNKRDLGLKYEQHVENAVNEYDQLMRQITADDQWEKNNDFIQKHDEYREKAAKDFNELIANINPSLPSEDVQEYRQKLDDKIKKRFNSIYKQSNDHNIHLQEMRETMKSGQFVQEASDIYETEMNKLLINGASCDNLQAENSKFQKMAEDKFKELCSSINCDTAKDLEKLVSLMDNRFEIFKTINKNNEDADFEKKKRRETKKVVKDYCDSMEMHISQYSSPPSDTNLMEKHTALKENAFISFERALGSDNITKDNKEEFGQEIEDRFSVFKSKNKTEQARVKLEKQEHETNKSQVKTARSEAYNLFVNKMRNHTQRYDSTIQNLCNQQKITAMEMFDRKTNLLKSKMSAIVQQERNNLSNEIEDNIKIVNEENKVRRNFLVLVVLVFALGLRNVFEVFNFCFG